MKQLLIAILLISSSFRIGDSKASLEFTKAEYNGIQYYLADAIRTIDSLKVVMHYSGVDSKANQSAERVQNELAQVYNFIYKIDSVFNPKKKQ